MSGIAYTRHVASRDERIPLIDRGEIQNVRSSQVYVFGNTDSIEVETENGGIEMSEIRTRGKSRRNISKKSEELSRSQTIEKEILPTDSLQSFALQYGCSVAEIKQANNLYSDQEFYALRKLKIPVRPNSILAESQEELKRKPTPLNLHSSTLEIEGTENRHSDNDTETNESECEVRTLSIRSALDSPNSFLKHMDNDIKKICQSASVRKDNLEEVARTLTVNCIRPLKKQERNLGTFCGLGWKGFVIVAVVITVVIPLLVGWYFYCKFGDNSKKLHVNICGRRS